MIRSPHWVTHDPYGSMLLQQRVDTTQPVPSLSPNVIPMTILPMVKVGNEWKVGTTTRDYHESWEQSGQIEVLAQ
jgi:hypothetical protein